MGMTRIVAQRCFTDSRVNLIRAYVKPSNETSVRAFEKTDFVPADLVELRGQPMQQFVLKRPTERHESEGAR